jgi:hypothetical protein
MSWIDKLEKHGTEVTREYKRRKPKLPKPKVESVICAVRPANDRTGDPGEGAIGWYTVQDGKLTMTDENGKSGDKPETELVTEANAHVVAARLTKKRWVASRNDGDFNRPLNYRPLGIA